MLMDESGAYLSVDVENNSQGGTGTISIDLCTHAIVGFSARSGGKQSSDNVGDFVTEVELRSGTMRHMLSVPESEKNNNISVGTGRHIVFATPAIPFGGCLTNQAVHVLDAADPVVGILDRCLRSSPFMCSLGTFC